MTHEELVRRAARWLRNSAVIPCNYRKPQADGTPYKRQIRCSVVLAERAGEMENPDAIGWAFRGNTSILIECKASRSDFLRDKEKVSRRTSDLYKLGRYRYYLTPPKIVKPEELLPGWGLLETTGNKVSILKVAERQEVLSVEREMHLLWSELAKYQLVWNGAELWQCRAKEEIEGTVRHCMAIESGGL